jgi:hypothetical protein
MGRAVQVVGRAMQVVGRAVQYVLVTVRIGLSPVDDLAYLPVLEWADGEVTVLPSLPFFPGAFLGDPVGELGVLVLVLRAPDHVGVRGGGHGFCELEDQAGNSGVGCWRKRIWSSISLI